MNSPDIIYLASETLKLILILSMPTVLTGAVIGLSVGLLQGLTQIQDQTISFALKLVGSMIALGLSVRWMGIELYKFTIIVFDKIAHSGV
ncbi:MAG: type III secretion protein S [Lentisphaeria bacterium]|jgi:type III secretion protein S